MLRAIFASMELPSPSTFLEKLLAAVERDGIATTSLVMDHLCYRVETMARYHEWKGLLSKNGRLLGEHLIGGRPIATFKLNAPFLFRGRAIEVIELPAPKPGSPYPDGYEHAEFVLGEHPRLFAARNPTLTWDLSGADKPINPDVRLNYGDFSVKFHERSLEEVIREELATP